MRGVLYRSRSGEDELGTCPTITPILLFKWVKVKIPATHSEHTLPPYSSLRCENWAGPPSLAIRPPPNDHHHHRRRHSAASLNHARKSSFFSRARHSQDVENQICISVNRRPKKGDKPKKRRKNIGISEIILNISQSLNSSPEAALPCPCGVVLI